MTNTPVIPSRSDSRTSWFYGTGETVYEIKVHEPVACHKRIPEAILHDIWSSQSFDFIDLKTTDDKIVEIINPGTYNLDSGPDFSNASLSIDGLKWCGSVEIHVSSKEWYHHKHHLDQRYNGTILHVTLFEDLHTGNLKRSDGSTIPEIVIHPRLKASLRALLYEKATVSEPPFPCQPLWHLVPDHVKIPWIQTLAKHRLAREKKKVAQTYLQDPNIERILHINLFKSLGYKKNGDAMAELASRIPLSISRELSTLHELEALHFGTAGLLPDKHALTSLCKSEKEYAQTLLVTFNRLQKTYKIPPMRSNNWLFFRLRPANFPTLRIAQAVSWLLPGQFLHHDPIGKLYTEIEKLDSMNHFFSLLQCTTSPFWHSHYHFKKSTSGKHRSLGKERLIKLFINAIVPSLLFISDQNNEPELEEKIRSILDTLPPEQDSVTKIYVQQGFYPANSVMSQGIHELFSSYCKPIQCLQCKIGRQLL